MPPRSSSRDGPRTTGHMEQAELRTLAVSLARLSRDRSSRDWIEWAADAGFAGVAIDAMAPGCRARELDRSARRELAALLRRRELALVGVDLWIPASHFLAGNHADRAMSATLGAIELAGELQSLVGGPMGPVLSMVLPSEQGRERGPESDRRRSQPATPAPPHQEGDSNISQMAALWREAASRAGVRIADHAPNRHQAGDAQPDDPIGVGIDPASVLLRGADPAAEVIRAGEQLRSVRLSDADSAGRCAVGDGALDIRQLRLAIMRVHWRGVVTVDLRGVGEPVAAAVRARELWSR